VRLRKGKVDRGELGGYPAAKAEAAERTDGYPAWDRDRSCLALGDNVGQAVFVTARADLALASAGVEFIAENGGGAGVRVRKAAK
jgi:hypothetical protein